MTPDEMLERAPDMSVASPAERPKVLLLGGQARSGSTLVDRSLGQVAGFVSCGEIRYLWDRGLRDDERCGCGLPLRGCPFWGRVGHLAFGGWDRIDLDEVLALREEVDRPRALPRLLRMGPTTSPFERQVVRYLSYLERVYPAILEAAQGDVVIDSSMSPLHALIVRRSNALDVRVAHLVRDARGVAHSSMKQVVRPEITDREVMMPTYSPPEAAIRWTTTNAVFGSLGRHLPTIRVAYEDFVREPRRELDRITTLMGHPLTAADAAFRDGPVIMLGTDHTVAGNPMRFMTGEVPIRADEAWRDKMDPRQRMLVTAFTYPMLRRYGFEP
jgi:hypothetical protein